MILTISITFILICCLLYLACGYFLKRNDRVFEERKRVNSICYKKALASSDPNWKSEWDNVMNRHTYCEMVHKFWIPVKDFYKDII